MVEHRATIHLLFDDRLADRRPQGLREGPADNLINLVRPNPGPQTRDAELRLSQLGREQ